MLEREIRLANREIRRLQDQAERDAEVKELLLCATLGMVVVTAIMALYAVGFITVCG